MRCVMAMNRSKHLGEPPITSPERSRIMRAVRSKDTKPELVVRKLLHRAGYRFRLHRRDIPGNPDIVFPSLRKVIFVHGCFWHGHDCKRGARELVPGVGGGRADGGGARGGRRAARLRGEAELALARISHHLNHQTPDLRTATASSSVGRPQKECNLPPGASVAFLVSARTYVAWRPTW